MVEERDLVTGCLEVLEKNGIHQGKTNSTDTASGGTESPAKKVKIMTTEEEERFVIKFQTPVSKIDQLSQVVLHVSGRGVSMKKQKKRKHDVKTDTLKKSLLDFPDQFLEV